MSGTRLKLLLLVVAHVTLAFAISKIDKGQFVGVLSAALSFAQIGLLPFWLVMGTWCWHWRLLTFSAGSAASYWCDWNFTQDVIGLLFLAGTELIVAAGLFVARYGWPKFRLVHTSEPMMSGTRLQFSLRQIMTLVVIVAVVVSVTRPIRAYLSSKTEVNDDGMAFLADESAEGTIEFLFEGSMYFGAIIGSWLGVWASICRGRPAVRAIVALVLSLGVGMILSCAFAPLMGGSPDTWWIDFPLLLIGQSLFTMASLLLVRSCGFRLVGRNHLASEVVAGDFGRRDEDVGLTIGQDRLVALS
jgi:hypothetical protein